MQEENERKVRFRDIIAAGKAQMLPLNALFVYRITPIYALVSILLIAGFGVLMEIDDERYFLPAISLMGIFAALTIVLLASLPYVRKKAVETELQRYDFDTSSINSADVWTFSAEGETVCFDRQGMQVRDVRYGYDDLCCRIVTGNWCRRINISLWCIPSEEDNEEEDEEEEGEGDEEEDGVLLPLTSEVLKMIEYLNIQLDNPETLDFILHHRAEAFRQIYDRGFVTLPK